MINKEIAVKQIAIIGLGYVGLPLARLFATKYSVIGFDINEKRITELQIGHDTTLEIEKDALKAVLKPNTSFNKGLYCTSNINHLKNCNYYVITVPTPIDKNKKPDLSSLYKSSESIGGVLKKGDIVIYESTVYPGATEDECVPILEKFSNLKFNSDFFVGYSPERINPGDKEHTIDKILKVTSGSNIETGIKVDNLYASIITAGTYLAPSIKVAEAAKVIENSQRDINIAFVNELAKIFNLMNIDTRAVLEAAGTKWNFIPFKPGLVGGHCIGVDPYYLAQKAQEIGYHPEIILAGRRVNDSMGQYIASEVVKMMLKNDLRVNKSKVLILGLTFKENCPDVRNTKIIDVIKHLKEYGININIYDPWINLEQVKTEYLLNATNTIPKDTYDAVIACVSHNEFINLNINRLLNKNGVVYDVKGIIKENVTGRL